VLQLAGGRSDETPPVAPRSARGDGILVADAQGPENRGLVRTRFYARSRRAIAPARSTRPTSVGSPPRAHARS